MSTLNKEGEIVKPAATATTQSGEKPVDASYDRYLRHGFIAMFVLIGVFGGWAAFFSIKGAVIAPGVIIVEGKPKTLQHLDGGIVGEILVKNGDVVEAGAVMLRLDPTAIAASSTIVEKRLYEALARVDRLKAERDDLNAINWSPRLDSVVGDANVTEVMAGQTKLFRARRSALRGQTGQLRERITQSNEQILGLKDLMGSKRTQLGLIGQELEGLEILFRKGAASKVRILGLEREKARLNGEIGTHRSEIARTRSAISETQIQILQVSKDNEAQVLTELREVESILSDLTEQLVTAEDQLKRIDVTSPVAGIVHDLTVTTIGGVIQPGQPMMQIVPVNDLLIIEARVQPIDIDQIYEGQPATITLSAFNQRVVPQFNGFVKKTSADSLIDQVTGIPYFNVLIEIPEEEMKKLGGLTLIPGMPADSFIQTQDRTVLQYILKPLNDQLNRTFREE